MNHIDQVRADIKSAISEKEFNKGDTETFISPSGGSH
jgi:hypothetical protein